jgi:hypothetical protein
LVVLIKIRNPLSKANSSVNIPVSVEKLSIRVLFPFFAAMVLATFITEMISRNARYERLSPARIVWIAVGVLVAIVAMAIDSRAQEAQGLLYAKVVTHSSEYEGFIRWGKEEITWTDHFNAAKSPSNYYQKIDEKEKDGNWLNFDWRLSSIWENQSTLFQFTCQFGDLKKIEPTGGDDVYATFKNGIKIKLQGEGYNDIGASIRVTDKELGSIDVKWSQIEKIEFLEAPTRLVSPYEVLYGTVETFRKGSFTGFIVWDKEERIGTDKLDGDTRDGDVSISFSEIARIEHMDETGCHIYLRSGRKLSLSKTNDVNNSNRGILVITENSGLIEIPREAFKSLVFKKQDRNPASYSSFPVPKVIYGTVKTIEDEELTGNIMYDIDETWDLEILEGDDDDVKYLIPFRLIKKIVPKNFNYSMVELRNGSTLLLGGRRDVSDENAGVLVFRKGAKEPQRVAWRKIIEINFN